jgi:hypothetical protein
MTEAETLYEWLDSLGFPDLAGCPFVEESDPRPDVERWLAERRPAFDTMGDWVKYNPQHVGWLLREGLLRAWACARKGQPDLAGRTLALVRQLHAEDQRHHPARSLQQHVSDEIAHLLMWQSVEAFADPAVSRRELLARFERILEKFPGAPGGPPPGDERFGWVPGGHPRHAREAAALLRQMIAEDEEHARRPARPPAELTRAEQVAELIFRLRDQSARQTTDPGSCNVFADERGEDSPAHRLVRIGSEAVPALIDALGDTRFTRCVGHHRSFYFSHHVLRVGDCALAVLEAIAGRRFWQATYTNAAMVKDGQAAETRQRVLAWWKEQGHR